MTQLNMSYIQQGQTIHRRHADRQTEKDKINNFKRPIIDCKYMKNNKVSIRTYLIYHECSMNIILKDIRQKKVQRRFSE